ncbi:hypothetical protein ACWEA7_32520, partial [Streptomyces sp. NPDC005093]
PATSPDSTYADRSSGSGVSAPHDLNLEHALVEPHRGRLSGRGGRHAGKWAVHRDPRDCRQVFIELDGVWHELLWNGLPSGQEVPAFSDARVGDVLRQAAKAGLKPRSDAELLLVLIVLVATKTPVDAWPTQMTRQQKTERARELARARAAALDRPAPAPPAGPSPANGRALLPAPVPAATTAATLAARFGQVQREGIETACAKLTGGVLVAVPVPERGRILPGG